MKLRENSTYSSIKMSKILRSKINQRSARLVLKSKNHLMKLKTYINRKTSRVHELNDLNVVMVEVPPNWSTD